MRILVIEDNHRLNSSLASSLAHEGYSVDSAYDGQEGQDLAEMTAYDLIILDLLLPEKDGLEVCRDLRRRRIHTPILLLTARDSIDDRVQGTVSRALIAAPMITWSSRSPCVNCWRACAPCYVAISPIKLDG